MRRGRSVSLGGDRPDVMPCEWSGRLAILAALDFHFGASETTLVLGEVPVAMNVEQTRAGVRIPDLILAFDVDVPGIIERNGYAINLVGKPPDFVLEVALPTTGRRNYTEKRQDYERFRIPEYWRFDGTGGDYHDAPLAGDRLATDATSRTCDGALRTFAACSAFPSRCWGTPNA